MKYLLLILCAAGSLSSYADDSEIIANGAASKPSKVPVEKAKKPSLRSLVTCAEGVNGSLFEKDGHSIAPWKVYDSDSIAPVAISVLVDDPKPYFLTVTSDKIMKTEAHEIHPSDPSYNWISRQFFLVLDLYGRTDEESNLPIVDPHEGVSKSWFMELFMMKGERSGITHSHYHREELTQSYSMIKATDSLTGKEADSAIDDLAEILRQRVLNSRFQAVKLYRKQQMIAYQNQGMTWPDDFARTGREEFFSDGEKDSLKKGLCGCEEALPEEVELSRKVLTDPKTDLRFWMEGEPNPRSLKTGELSCGES